MEDYEAQHQRYNASRLAVLDTLETVLRAQDENGTIGPDILEQLVAQVQDVLQPPMLDEGGSLMQDLQHANETAESWRRQAELLEEKLAAAQHEADQAKQTVLELTHKNVSLQLDVEALTAQLSAQANQQAQDPAADAVIPSAMPAAALSQAASLDTQVTTTATTAKPSLAPAMAHTGEQAVSTSTSTSTAAGPSGQQPTSLATIDERMQQLQGLNRQLEQELRATQAAAAAAADREAAAQSAMSDLKRLGQDAQGRAQALQGRLAEACARADAAEVRAAGLDARLRECERDLGQARAAGQAEHAASAASAATAAARVRELEQQLVSSQQRLEDSLKAQKESDRRPQPPATGSPDWRAAAAAAAAAVGHSSATQSAAATELVMVQAELQGARQSNRLLTQRLMELEVRAGAGAYTHGMGPTQAEHIALQAEVEGLLHTAQQLREQVVSARQEIGAYETAGAAWAAEREGLQARLLGAERRANAAAAERDAKARAVAMAEGEAAGARHQAATVHQAAEAEANQSVHEQGALVGALTEARRRLATSSMALEHEVGTWRLATNQAVSVAEEAQSKVALLDRQLAELDSQLRAKAAEAEAKGVEAAELRLQLEEAKGWLNKRTSFLERCESSVLRPLASWYSLHGYPHLLSQPNHHLHNPNHPASPPAKARARPGPTAPPTPAMRPGSRGPWPAPLPADGAPGQPSKGFVDLQLRVSRVLGTVAAAVDTNADKRLDIAAAAIELLTLRIDELQQRVNGVTEGARMAAILAAEHAQRRLDQLAQAHEEQLARLRDKADLESKAAQDAQAAALALRKDIAAAVMEACAERDTAQQLREQLAALGSEVNRQKEMHEAAQAEMQMRVEEMLNTRHAEQQRAEQAAHAAGVADGRASMQPALDQLQGEVLAAANDLEARRQECAHVMARLADLEQELNIKEEQALVAAREAVRESAAREHEWLLRERQLQTELRTRLDEAAKEAAHALEAEKARGRALLDEEYRAGLSKVEEAASRWEQQRQALEAERDEQLEDCKRQAAAEAVREARRAMEQEYMQRDEELRRVHEASLAMLGSRADAAQAAWRNREKELQEELDSVEGQLRAARRELSEVRSCLAAAQADRAQVAKERDDALGALEAKVVEYRTRLAGLEATQEALKARQQEQALERDGSTARLQQQMRALADERNTLEEQTVKLQASLFQQRELAAAAQEASERAWAAAHTASVALQEATLQAAAREEQLTAMHRDQVQQLEARHMGQLAGAAAQLSIVRAKQDALGGALLANLANQPRGTFQQRR